MSDDHLTAVVLAEYDEGLLPERRAADVAAHLADCPTCTETSRRLSEVSHRLAAEPATLPIPADVAARLDLTLAGERTSVAREEAGPPRHRTGNIVGLRPWRARMPTVLAAAATVAAVAFAGLVVGTGSGGDDGGDAGQTTVAEGGTDELAADAAQPVPDAEGGVATAPEFLPFDLQSSRTALTEQVREIVAIAPSLASGRTGPPRPQSNQENAGGCGAALASDVGQDLIGSAPTNVGVPGAVLVVTTAETADAAQGWVLPDCDATASDALAMVTVPAE